MKKILFAAILAIVLSGCTQDRNSILKVYNWADYIDESLLEEFEDWYLEQTGENVESYTRRSTSTRPCSPRSSSVMRTMM